MYTREPRSCTIFTLCNFEILCTLWQPLFSIIVKEKKSEQLHSYPDLILVSIVITY